MPVGCLCLSGPLPAPPTLFHSSSLCLCSIGFFITTPLADRQLELDLAEGKCPLDSQDIAITLFRFDALDAKTGIFSREYSLFDMLQVRAPALAPGGAGAPCECA
jgi:hypothetical protein